MSSAVKTLKIEKLTDRTPFANVLIYGESGVGKTVFASTAPRPILWLESEGGTLSIPDKTGIDIAKVDGLETYREALVYLEGKKDHYKSVVLDSLSETSAAILKDIMHAAVADDQSRDAYSPLFAEWGKLTGVMREIVRAFRDLPMNTIVTALQREDKDDMTGRMKVRPRLSPTLADELPAFFDAVMFMYAATPKKGEVDGKGVEADEDGNTIIRNALIKPTGKYSAKLRAPAGTTVPDYLTDPTFDKVAKLLGL